MKQIINERIQMADDITNALMFKAQLVKTFIQGAIENSKQETVEIINISSYVPEIRKYPSVSYRSSNLDFNVVLRTEEDLDKSLDDITVTQKLNNNDYMYNHHCTNVKLTDILTNGNYLNKILFLNTFSGKKYIGPNSIKTVGKNYRKEIFVDTPRFEIKYDIIVHNRIIETIELCNIPLEPFPEDMENILKGYNNKIKNLNLQVSKVLSIKSKELANEIKEYAEKL